MQGRLEALHLLNMDNVQALVDRRVENITGVINKLSSTCTSQCAVQNTPQCKRYFTIISSSQLSVFGYFECCDPCLPIYELHSLVLSFKVLKRLFISTVHVFLFDRKPPSFVFSMVLCSSPTRRTKICASCGLSQIPEGFWLAERTTSGSSPKMF